MQITKAFRIIAILNVVAMVAQATFAGGILSGMSHSLEFHTFGARFLVVWGVLQGVAALVVVSKKYAQRGLAIAAFGMVAAEVLEYGLGETRNLLLHVPLALLIFGGAVRQVIWALQAGRRDAGEPRRVLSTAMPGVRE